MLPPTPARVWSIAALDAELSALEWAQRPVTQQNLRDAVATLAATGVGYAEQFLKFDGTDETVAFTAMLTSILAATDRAVISFPAGTLRIDGQILIPNDGTTPPKQKSLRFTGAGPSHNGQGAPALGGTIIDLRYNGAGVAMIDTRGLGYLEIDHLTLACNDATVTKPFIQTTNTTLHIHDVEFQGSLTKAGSAGTCDQDAIILGGTTLNLDGSSTAAFQGYGTVIRDCFFSHIRRAVYGRTFCNAVQIVDNTVWTTCGSNLAGGAAIEFLGLSGNTCTGNVVMNNLIEIAYYPYAIKADWTVNSTFAFNNCFDQTATTLASVRFEANATQNLVIDGYRNDLKPGISDASSGGSNTFITGHANQVSTFPQPQTWTNITNLFKNASKLSSVTDDGAGNQWYHRVFGANGEKWYLDYVLSGGGQEDQYYFWRVDANTRHLRFQGSGGHKIFGEPGSISLDSTAGTATVGGTAAGILGVTKAGFYGTAGVTKQTVTGAKGANAALGSLIAALVAMGMITDTTTA